VFDLRDRFDCGSRSILTANLLFNNLNRSHLNFSNIQHLPIPPLTASKPRLHNVDVSPTIPRHHKQTSLTTPLQQHHLAPVPLARRAQHSPQAKGFHHLVHRALRIRKVDHRDCARAAPSAPWVRGVPSGRRQCALWVEQGSGVYGEGPQ
jgi:hypothetical protein